MGLGETVDAKKQRFGKKEALALAATVDTIYSMRGTKVVHLDLKKDKPDEATLLASLLGPSGNLRAPTVRQGRTLLVGFSPEVFKGHIR